MWPRYSNALSCLRTTGLVLHEVRKAWELVANFNYTTPAQELGRLAGKLIEVGQPHLLGSKKRPTSPLYVTGVSLSFHRG